MKQMVLVPSLAGAFDSLGKATKLVCRGVAPNGLGFGVH
jgi:hypothetical protein